MKGDFSRRTFDPRKHYAGVLMQQGRVQTDADWNEEGDIRRRRERIEARDVIGACGAPVDDAGFAINVTGKSLTIGAGRYWVDGLLCVNETGGLAYEAQPDLPGAPDWLDALDKANATSGIVYLDVWERHVTALDDPLLREVALGGPDTSTRIKTVWQVRVLPVTSSADASKLKELQARRVQFRKKLDEAVAAGAKPEALAQLQAEIVKLDAAIAKLAAGASPSCGDRFREWDDLVAEPGGTLNARTTPPPPAAGPCVVPPTAGYRRLENQLYRVEVHRPGPVGTATFKWSRDNGSVVTAIEKISGKEVTVRDLGPDDVLGFASGQWVEISDDRSELDGRPGQLVQIDAVNSSLRRITLKTAPTPLSGGADGVDNALRPKLRRWDQSGAAAGDGGVATAGAWLPLEDGVEVQFGGGRFATGDYWLIPARTATGEIEWPPFAVPNTSPEAQARRGIHHRFCRLALLGFDAAKKAWGVVEDCRRLFPPLTESCCDANSMRVEGTNWKNDDVFLLASLAQDGLRIRLDAAPDPASLTGDTVEVALEMPVAEAQGPSQTLFNRQFLQGDVTRDATDDHVVVWKLRKPSGRPGRPAAPRAAEERARKGRRAPLKPAPPAKAADVLRFTLIDLSSARIRVRLKGHVIWSESGSGGTRRFLDGQAFGLPGLRADGKTPRIDLAFPSGHGARASDFESWFFLAVRPQVAPFQIATIRFLNPNNASSSAGDVKPPLPAGQRVAFKAGEQIRAVEITFNRAIDPATVGAGPTAGVFVEQVDAAARRRLVVDLQVKENVLLAVLKDPPVFGQGNFALTCLGTPPVSPAAAPAALAAAADHTALDGDYDGAAGGNLALPFTAT